MKVFIDTSAFIALLVPKDENHAAAAAVWRDLVTREVPLVTTNYVVIETCAVLHRRFGAAAARKFVEDAVPSLTVEWVGAEMHDAGVSNSLLSARRGPSVVDCVSFAAMRKLGINAFFAFDPHFAEQGFSDATG